MLFAAHNTAISLFRHRQGGVYTMRRQLFTTFACTVTAMVAPTIITKIILNKLRLFINSLNYKHVMTKHLRLLLLALLTMVCMGGYSQTDLVYKTLSFPDDNKAANGVGAYDKTWTATIGDFSWSIANFNNNSWNASWTYIKCGRKKDASAASIATSTAMDEKITKIVVNYYSLKNVNKINSLTLTVASDANFSTVIETVNPTETLSTSTKTSTFTISSPAANLYYKITYDCAVAGDNGIVVINSVDYYHAVNKTATSLSFTGLEGEGVVLASGKLNGADFTGYKAEVADGVAGTISYTSSNEDLAVVDKNGDVVVDEDVYGKATITATFTPTDADAYLPSTAQYTISNIHFTAYDNVADLRAALDDGTLTADDSHFIQVTFADAKVVYKNEWTSSGTNYVQYFIREGEGENAKAICLYQPGISLRSSSKLNGQYTGVLYSRNGMLCLTQCENTSAEELTESQSSTKADPLEISTDDVAKHVCDLVAVKGATVTNGLVSNGTSETATAPTFYNQFASNTASMKLPYSGANIDMNSAIVITYQKDASSDMLYELCPTEANSVVYYFSEDNAETKLGTNYEVPVVLKRTFKEGEWNTLCLPFGLIEAQLKALFGDDVQIRTLSAVDGNTLTFTAATTLKAEQPCLIKLGAIAEDNTYTATGLSIEAHTEGANKCTPTDGATSMVGVYQLTDVTTEATGKALFLGDGNKFYQAAADTQMKGFRAYFDVPTDTDPNKVQAVIDGEATGIDALNGDVVKQNSRVYNLNGQCVGTSLEQLQRGVYIQNGKKVIVK